MFCENFRWPIVFWSGHHILAGHSTHSFRTVAKRKNPVQTRYAQPKSNRSGEKQTLSPQSYMTRWQVMTQNPLQAVKSWWERNGRMMMEEMRISPLQEVWQLFDQSGFHVLLLFHPLVRSSRIAFLPFRSALVHTGALKPAPKLVASTSNAFTPL